MLERISFLERKIECLREDIRRVQWASSVSVLRGEIIKIEEEIEHLKSQIKD